MSDSSSEPAVRRLLVVFPTWLGDCVMAMPTLRALRERYPEAHITVLVGRALKAIVAPNPWCDRIVTHKLGSDDPRHKPRRLAQRLKQARFDTAVLLPNSFRSALLVRRAGIPRRVGYARDGRGWLLTDRLLPLRIDGRFAKVPTRAYYLGLAYYLGATDIDPRMELFTRPEDDAEADALLARAGWRADRHGPLVLLNPGANYGDAKMWPPAHFAAFADRAHRQWHATVAVSGAPGERAILDQVIDLAQAPILDLPAHGLKLRLLKSIIRRTALTVTNDTGPRHIAIAMGRPVVTVFGPTDPKWTVIGYPDERQLMLDVECGPCQLKRCPIDHRCMNWLTADMVFDRAAELLPAGPPPTPETETSA